MHHWSCCQFVRLQVYCICSHFLVLSNVVLRLRTDSITSYTVNIIANYFMFKREKKHVMRYSNGCPSAGSVVWPLSLYELYLCLYINYNSDNFLRRKVYRKWRGNLTIYFIRRYIFILLIEIHVAEKLDNYCYVTEGSLYDNLQ